MTGKISNIFIVDDHPLVREWLTILIGKCADLKVCGEADDVPAALQALATVRPDLAVIDLSLKRGSGIQLIRSMRDSYPDVAIIVVSMHDERVYAESALWAGARGYIMKQECATQIVKAIRAVLCGNLYLSDAMTCLLAEKTAIGSARTVGLPLVQIRDTQKDKRQFLADRWTTMTAAQRADLCTAMANGLRKDADSLPLHAREYCLNLAKRWLLLGAEMKRQRLLLIQTPKV